MEHAAVLRDPFSKWPTHASIDTKPMTSKGSGSEMVLEDFQSPLLNPPGSWDQEVTG